MKLTTTLLLSLPLLAASCRKEDKTVEYQVDSAHAIVSWYDAQRRQETIVVNGSWRKDLGKVEHDYSPMINVRPAPGVKADVHIIVDGEIWKSSNTATYTEAYQYP